jgi:hypothetical protein
MMHCLGIWQNLKGNLIFTGNNDGQIGRLWAYEEEDFEFDHFHG